MIAVLKHELSGYFHSLSAYIFGAFLLVFVGIGAMFYNIYQAVANFEYVLKNRPASIFTSNYNNTINSRKIYSNVNCIFYTIMHYFIVPAYICTIW